MEKYKREARVDEDEGNAQEGKGEDDGVVEKAVRQGQGAFRSEENI